MFLALSETGTAYYIFSDIVDYSNYEVVTTIKTEYDQPTEFPTISFCSHTPNSYDSIDFSHAFFWFANDFEVKENPSNHYESSFFTQNFID